MAVLSAVALTSCRSDKKYALTALDLAKGRIQYSFDSLNQVLASTAADLAKVNDDPDAIRANLKKFLSSSPLAREVAFVTPQGSRKVIEPSDCRKFEGADISKDPATSNTLQAKKPTLSKPFNSREGYLAMADIHPVMSGSTLVGALESKFTPVDMIHGIRITLVTAPEEIWVMEQDGTVLYDQDLTTVGKNVFKDECFSKFDTFRSACQAIAGAESGEVNYSYYATGSTNITEKLAYWKTIEIPDHSWKIVYELER